MTPGAVTIRFEASSHTYIDEATGAVLPSITQMLDRAGWIDDQWYTEDSCTRGQAVHQLTADYDLGALNPATCVTAYRGYLLAHVAAMAIERPAFRLIEEPLAHPTLRFAGRPDRAGLFHGVAGVLEIKSGLVARSHPIQTALQAILVAPVFTLAPEMLTRLVLYVKANGKFRIEEHRDRRDFDEARRILRCFAG